MPNKARTKSIKRTRGCGGRGCVDAPACDAVGDGAGVAEGVGVGVNVGVGVGVGVAVGAGVGVRICVVPPDNLTTSGLESLAGSAVAEI